MALDFLSPLIIDENDQMNRYFFNVRNINDKVISGFSGPGLALITIHSSFAQKVRNAIDLFQNHFKNITLYDLGNLINNDPSSIRQVIDFLHNMDIIPVFIGIQIDSVRSLAVASNSNLCQVSNCITDVAQSDYNQNYLAFQRHLCNLNDIFAIEEFRYNSLSLGKLRSYPTLLEPVMRDTQMLYTDLKCIRRSDVPNIPDSLPTGMNAEELCQMMKYAGTAQGIRSIFFNDLEIIHDNSPEFLLMAEAIWYFTEGLNMRVREHPTVSEDFSEFVIYSNSYENDLVFKRNNQTLKWWLVDQSMSENIRYLACAYEEYEMASGGEEIPDRLLKFLHHGKD